MLLDFFNEFFKCKITLAEHLKIQEARQFAGRKFFESKPGRYETNRLRFNPPQANLRAQAIADTFALVRIGQRR